MTLLLTLVLIAAFSLLIICFYLSPSKNSQLKWAMLGVFIYFGILLCTAAHTRTKINTKLTEQALTIKGMSYNLPFYIKFDSSQIDSYITTCIDSAAIEFDIDRKLIVSVIQNESEFNWSVISPSGAMGLMQIMPIHFRGLGGKNPFEPKININKGCELLKSHLVKYKDLDIALAAYHAGIGNVAKYNGVPDIKETKDYIVKVKESYYGK